jgi:hypothetical protein
VPMLVNGSDVAVATQTQPKQATYIYLVSALAGQRIERVTVPPGVAGPDIFGWVAGHLAWSQDGPGVYADTDPTQLVPGTAGYRLTGQGAWTATGGHGTPSMSWWNLDTDERHTVTAPASGTWSCSYGDYVAAARSLRATDRSVHRQHRADQWDQANRRVVGSRDGRLRDHSSAGGGLDVRRQRHERRLHRPARCQRSEGRPGPRRDHDVIEVPPYQIPIKENLLSSCRHIGDVVFGDRARNGQRIGDLAGRVGRAAA